MGVKRRFCQPSVQGCVREVEARFVAGILPTLVNARTNISRAVLDEVRAAYPELLYPFGVEYSVRHSEASLAGRPIVLHDPGHQGARAYTELARRFA